MSSSTPIYDAAVRAANKHFATGRDRRYFLRQMRAENNFGDSTSPAGALGPAQIMPATARAWGVRNPHDPNEAYDEAAAHMANYLRQYGGSWAKALTAYNAGPGRVGHALPAETKAYIAKILRGASDAVSGGTHAVESSDGLRASVTRTPPVSKRDEDQAIVDTLLSPGSVKGSIHRDILGQAVARIHSGVYTTTTPGRTTVHLDQTRGDAPDSAPARSRDGQSPLMELFWQGQGGINVKNGQRVAQGFVEGHTDHVHLAAGPKTIVKFGRLAQQMGLHVGENSHFGGVHPVHAPHSYHYRDEAIDVSGDPRVMERFAHRVAHLYGVK